MTGNINTILDHMVEHLVMLNHLKDMAHHSLQDTVDYVYDRAVEVVVMVGTINNENTTVGDAEWYALLRDTRDMAAQVDAQMKGLEAMNDALTLSA